LYNKIIQMYVLNIWKKLVMTSFKDIYLGNVDATKLSSRYRITEFWAWHVGIFILVIFALSLHFSFRYLILNSRWWEIEKPKKTYFLSFFLKNKQNNETFCCVICEEGFCGTIFLLCMNRRKLFRKMCFVFSSVSELLFRKN
jgi:hypothetical protein